VPAAAAEGSLVTGPDADDRPVRVTAWVHGYVQGVGFRWWTRAAARGLGLVGTVTNLPDGRVEVVAEGSEPACRSLVEALRGPGTPGRVRNVIDQWSKAQGRFTGFVER
jgi:acylphosphatase